MKKRLQAFLHTYWRKILLSLLAALLVELAYLVMPPETFYRASQQSDAVSIWNEDIKLVNCSIVDGKVVPSDNDPQIYLYNLNGEIANILITLGEETTGTINYQLFYPDEQGDVSQENSMTLMVPEGQKQIVFELPSGEYSFLRLDVDGVFPVEDITASGQPLIKTAVRYQVPFSAARVGCFAVLFFVLAVILQKKIPEWKNAIADGRRSLQGNSKKAVLFLTLFLAFCFFLYPLVVAFSESKMVSFQTPLYLFWVAVFLTVSAFYFLYGKIDKKPEQIFTVLALSAGLMLCLLVPLCTWISWDDDTHYIRSVQVFSTLTQADIVMQHYASQTPLNYFFSVEIFEERSAYLNDLYQNSQFVYMNANMSIESLDVYRRMGYYLPGAVIFLGRLLRLPFVSVYLLGKTSILLCYVALVRVAIKRLKTGKMILATIALFPTGVFLASNYSCDSWITAWIMLGMSYFFAELQEPDQPLTVKNAAIIIGSLVLGFGPKAVYMPILAILLLLPKTKFSSSKKYRKYLAFICVAAVLVLMSFIVPLLFGSVPSDTRGGATVSGEDQIFYILSHPLTYAKILLGFLWKYVSSLTCITDLAYLGTVSGSFYLILLGAVIFTDKSALDCYTSTGKVRLITAGSVFIALCLVATSLYITFTPVGYSTINGCQQRYMMPLLFPLFYVLGSPKIKNQIDRKVYHTMVLAANALLLYSTIFSLCISRYYV